MGCSYLRVRLPGRLGRAPRHSRSGLPARGEHGFDRLAGAAELDDGPLDLRLLAPQPADLLLELAQRDPQLRHLAVAEIVEIQHLPDFLEREADRLAHQHVFEPCTVTPAVEPPLPVAAGRDQSLLLVEAQGAGADAEFLGQLPDREDFPPCRASIEAGGEIGNGGPGIAAGPAVGIEFGLHGPARVRSTVRQFADPGGIYMTF